MADKKKKRAKHASKSSATGEATAGSSHAKKKAKTTEVLKIVTGDGAEIDLSMSDLRVGTGTTPTMAGGTREVAWLSVAGESVEIPLDGGAMSRHTAATRHSAAPASGRSAGGGGPGGPGGSDDDTESDAGNARRGSGCSGGPGGAGGSGAGGAGRQPAQNPGGQPLQDAGNRPAMPRERATSPLPPAPRTPAVGVAPTAPAAPTILIREAPARDRRLRLPKYRGLDGQMPISTWLQAVHTAKRQQYSRDHPWNPTDVYFEMVQHLKDEALLWYGTIADTIDPETDENLARMMRDRYEERRTDPEVVASLQDRRQGRGEPLVEYAANLRAIVADRRIGEEWLIDAFLKGMHNQNSATFVRGRDPVTLNEAVDMATHQVGRYGEGHGVGLEESLARQDARATVGTQATRRGATTPLGIGRREQSATTGNSGTGTLGLSKPPRYDKDGRLVNSTVPDWLRGVSLVPPGYALVPLGASGVENANTRTSGNQGNQRSGRNRNENSRQDDTRSDGHQQEASRRERDADSRPARRGGTSGTGGSGRTLKMEPRDDTRAPMGMSSRYGPPQPLLTREARLENFRRYQNNRARMGTATARPTGVVCYYCLTPGHFVRDCPYKGGDLAAEAAEEKPQAEDSNNGGNSAGNEERA